ncbi:hypothetical protein SPHINGO391_500060 [Sphingomonas aurantiaca]|uniref:Uncharacterized protein n=1 Tax=Sphingomonas aurantiaca TaxID=185949 RepID=A0A5E8AE03_9SPHN|nr:hypothetical protein SPHINGO391_500060 [Sphingomonas aurantiaca]
MHRLGIKFPSEGQDRAFCDYDRFAHRFLAGHDVFEVTVVGHQQSFGRGNGLGSCQPVSLSQTFEGWFALLVKRLYAFREVLGSAQSAVAMPFKFDCGGQGRIFGVVEKFFGSALCKGGEGHEFLHKCISCDFELTIRDDLSRNTPVMTSTRRSRPVALGSGSSISTRASVRSIVPGCW